MNTLFRHLFLFLAFLTGFSGSLLAQQADNGNNKQSKQATETTTTNATTAKKNGASTEKNTPPPNEKSNWAIRIKQGEKWYQLSLELAF